MRQPSCGNRRTDRLTDWLADWQVGSDAAAAAPVWRRRLSSLWNVFYRRRWAACWSAVCTCSWESRGRTIVWCWSPSESSCPAEEEEGQKRKSSLTSLTWRFWGSEDKQCSSLGTGNGGWWHEIMWWSDCGASACWRNWLITALQSLMEISFPVSSSTEEQNYT